MVQVIPQMDRQSQISSAVGQGLGDVLSLLAQKKAAKLQKRGRAEGLAALGLPPEFANLDTPILKEVLSQQGKQRQLGALMEILSPGGGVEEEAVVEESGPSRISDQQILEASLVDPNLARLLQSQKQSSLKRGLEERKFSQRSQEAAFKETKDFRKEARNSAKTAKENLNRLNRMEKLINAGNLQGPAYNEVLKRIGFDIPALKNPDTQEFEKLSVDFLKGAKEIFGARVTNYEMENFLKSIPTLSQSHSGKRRVIRNLQIMNKGALLKDKAVRDIIRENDGVPPLDLQEQVDERVDPQITALSEEFVSGNAPDEKQDVLEAGEVLMIDPAGRRRAVRKSDVKAARSAGYKLG